MPVSDPAVSCAEASLNNVCGVFSCHSHPVILATPSSKPVLPISEVSSCRSSAGLSKAICSPMLPEHCCFSCKDPTSLAGAPISHVSQVQSRVVDSVDVEDEILCENILQRQDERHIDPKKMARLLKPRCLRKTTYHGQTNPVLRSTGFGSVSSYSAPSRLGTPMHQLLEDPGFDSWLPRASRATNSVLLCDCDPTILS